MRSDRRSALFALPLFSGDNLRFAPADGTGGVPEALAQMLAGLGFPTGSGFASR